MRLVLCGSALSVMSNLLVGAQALRGRASHDLSLGTFDYRTAADFWGIDDARLVGLAAPSRSLRSGRRNTPPENRTRGDLDRLGAIRTLLVDRDLAPLTTKLLLFSANGFDRNLVATADSRDDVELIDLDRLYRGS